MKTRLQYSHTTGFLWFNNINGTCPCNAYSRIHTLACMQTTRLTQTLFLGKLPPQDGGIHSKHSTNHKHELEGYFRERKLTFQFRFLHFLCQEHILLKVAVPIMVTMQVAFKPSVKLQTRTFKHISYSHTWRRHKITVTTSPEKSQIMTEKGLKIPSNFLSCP